MNCCDKHGHCNQGRNCPARQACELPDEDTPPMSFDEVMNLVVALFAAIGVVAVIMALGFWSAR
jgi:hypothetical protein